MSLNPESVGDSQLSRLETAVKAKASSGDPFGMHSNQQVRLGQTNGVQARKRESALTSSLAMDNGVRHIRSVLQRDADALSVAAMEPLVPMNHRLEEQTNETLGRKRGSAEISNMAMDNGVGSILKQDPLFVVATMKPFAQMNRHPQNPGPVQDRKSRRLPCKARGMGDSHTSATAYFDIPHDLQHGAVLACCHHACASSGRRFRYCQVCEVPVAKRNFQKRHSHGLIPVGDPILSVNDNRVTFAEETNEDDDAEAEADDSGDSDAKHRRSVSYDAADTLNQLSAPRKPAASDKMSVKNRGESSQLAARSMKLTPQEFQWLALFHSRPSVHDTQGMEKWMTSIIDVSESASAPAPPATARPLSAPAPSAPGPPETSAPNPSLALNGVGMAHALPESKNEPSSKTAVASVPSVSLLVSKNQPSSQTAAASAPSVSALSVGNPSAEATLPIATCDTAGANPVGGQLNASPLALTKTTSESCTLGAASLFKDDSAMLPPALPKNNSFEMKAPDENGYTTKVFSRFKEAPLNDTFPVDSIEKQRTTAADSTRPSYNPLDDNDRPKTLADYVAKRRAAAAFASGGKPAETKEFEVVEDESQASSVATRPGIRRRQSVQDARQLMGLIKLAGLDENELDELF